MALNLRKLAKTAADVGETAPQRRQAERREEREHPFDYSYGRGELPPPRGSDWGEFLDWASERSVITEADRRLAIDGWMGRLRWQDEAICASGSPSP